MCILNCVLITLLLFHTAMFFLITYFVIILLRQFFEDVFSIIDIPKKKLCNYPCIINKIL